MEDRDDDTHDRTIRLGESRALQTLRSGLALARELEAERQRKALVDADQRMKLVKERRATFRRLLSKL